MNTTTMPGRHPADRGVPAAQRCPLLPAAPVGRLSDLVRLLGGEAQGAGASCDMTIPLWRVRSGATLFHEGAHADSVHVIRSGTFKCLRTLQDGYEQVLAFPGPGEVLGFEARCGGHQATSAVALEEACVYVLPVRQLDRWRQADPVLDRALMTALGRQLGRAGAMVEMMAAVAAEVRLARFLLWFSSRMAELGRSPSRLLLCMSRRDIASLLGVAHETVSRSFGMLAGGGLLHVDNRDVEILDFEGLRACTHSTRGLAEEMPRRPPRTGGAKAAAASQAAVPLAGTVLR